MTDTPEEGGIGQPIGFRARPELAGRLGERDERRGTAARRDLTRYYEWLDDELATIELSPDGADELLLALRELAAQPISGARSWAPPPGFPVHRFIVAELERRPKETGQALEVARTWTPGQIRAALDAVERAWRTLPQDAARDARGAALEQVGLLRAPRR